MSQLVEHSIRLRDGRNLGYAEYGDPNGKPILYFHGFPSSRFDGYRSVSEEIATRLHARMIVVERPGFGLSDFKHGRSIVEWPNDIIELADTLNLERFYVMGYSGGGPYVAACACMIPTRLISAGIISGLGPLGAPGAYDGMNKSDRQLYNLAQNLPLILRIVYWTVARDLRHNPAKFFSEYAKVLSEPDRATIARDEILGMLSKMAREAFRAGGRGVTRETILATRPWGFSLKDIHVPVFHWQGEADKAVPPSQGRYLSENIPNCQTKFYPNEGHFSLINNYFEEIIRTFIG